MSRLIYNQNLKQYSRELRQDMTDAERRLWSAVRMKQAGGYRFCRQKIVGSYIVDFFCHEAKLVIEVDGSQHYTVEGLAADKVRDNYLRNCGLRVLRFTDTDVLTNIEGVFEVILETLIGKIPLNPPLRKGEENDGLA